MHSDKILKFQEELKDFFLIIIEQNNTLSSDISKLVAESRYVTSLPLVVFKKSNLPIQVLVAMFLVPGQMQ